MTRIRWPSPDPHEIDDVAEARERLHLKEKVTDEIWETAPEHLRTLRRMLFTAQAAAAATKKRAEKPPA